VEHAGQEERGEQAIPDRCDSFAECQTFRSHGNEYIQRTAALRELSPNAVSAGLSD
jgi:hypothetical protein